MTVFVVPEGHIKNGEARLIVMNRTARSIVKEQRKLWHGKSEFVFPNPRTKKPFTKIRNTSWKTAWERAGLPVSPHIETYLWTPIKGSRCFERNEKSVFRAQGW